jgi:TATA-box binding protein (TBP) (component of TFIID and TFIIIB)
LNNEINLKDVFWKVPVIPYATPQNGVIKKQMKFNSLTQEELDGVQENLKHENHYEEQVITSINNPNGRIKFKDIRKISVGISKKDLMSYRCKKKSAFYNCFVMILRIKIDDVFKEFHIKVFNTGKLEIPGVQNDKIFETVLKNIINTLQPHVVEKLEYLQKSDTVLINSNFNCGFYINREALFDILKFKYNIQCIYDPCSYPGIQCKFYYNEDLTDQTGIQPTQTQDVVKDENGKKIKDKKIVEVSFMIFRTGSILIVGMCNDNVLYIIYEYLKLLLTKEFHKINQKVITSENKISKDKKKKVRRKNIQITIQPQTA